MKIVIVCVVLIGFCFRVLLVFSLFVYLINCLILFKMLKKDVLIFSFFRLLGIIERVNFIFVFGC